MVIFILFGAFLSVVFIFISVYSIFFSTKAITADRLKKFTTADNPYVENPKSENKKQGLNLFKMFGFLGKFLPANGR